MAGEELKVRIIAGSAKGRRLRSPRSGTRPLTGRVREALFSSLGERVVDARVLDLYAGSGSIGLEALSRGAADAVFVENDREAFAVLGRNLEVVGLGGTPVRAEVEAFLRLDSARYDLVFVDPPYALPLASVEDVLGLTARRLDESATLVLHRRAGEGEPLGENLWCRNRRRYGDAEIWVYAKEET